MINWIWGGLVIFAAVYGLNEFRKHFYQVTEK